jgi:DNA-binding PadR family transcriptional regulator
MYAPYHGYLIMHVMSEMIGPWQKVSPGTLYPLLGRLEQDGLIQSSIESDTSVSSRRTAKVFTITDAGRSRFRELMLDIVSSIGEYQRLFYLKLPHLEFLSRDEQLQILEHYRDYCRIALRHQDRITRELEMRRGSTPTQAELDTGGVTAQGVSNGLLVTHHMRTHWELELTWVEQLIAQVMERR